MEISVSLMQTLIADTDLDGQEPVGERLTVRRRWSVSHKKLVRRL